LRLGYAVGEKSAMDAMKNFRPAWNVNALAQVAGLAALQSEEYLSETLAKLRNEKDALILGLKKLGYEPVPSRTNYFLLPAGSGAQFREKLLRQGILVRDCTSFGLPSYVRIATRTQEENTRLLKTLQPFFKESSKGMKAKVLMIQGSSSSAGKSLLVTALCRIYAQRGLRVAPFKAQNMSNNAAVCAMAVRSGVRRHCKPPLWNRTYGRYESHHH
jgi:hypothetical protein